MAPDVPLHVVRDYHGCGDAISCWVTALIYCVTAVLGPDELAAIQSKLESAFFVDGAGTAGWSAREVKRNLQVTPGASEYEQIARIAREAFMRSGELQIPIPPTRCTT